MNDIPERRSLSNVEAVRSAQVFSRRMIKQRSYAYLFMRKMDEELNQAQSLKYAVTSQYHGQKNNVENLF